MKIYVLTQEDAFYIPRILDHLLAVRRDVAEVAIVPGEMRTGQVGKYLRFMGPRDFTLQVLNLLVHKVLDVASRVFPTPYSTSVAGAARRARVPSRVVPRVNDPDFLAHLRKLEVDLIVSIACPQRLRGDLLQLPARGCINLHGSLLPRYQGLLPSFWVLARGERETGVTVHWMNEEIDAGELLLQEKLAIEPGDTMHSLVLRSKVGVGRQLLTRAIERIERGDAPRQPMDTSRATYFAFPDPAAVAEFRGRGRRFI